MSHEYEEIVQGETIRRLPPGPQHEVICARLHAAFAAALAGSAVSRLAAPRSIVELTPGTLLRPDAVLVTLATLKPWLIAEIIDSNDHTTDTVTKKAVYEDCRVPRLWMVDPRYGNVEVYHATPYGLALKHVLAGRDRLAEPLLPGLELALTELFACPPDRDSARGEL